MQSICLIMYAYIYYVLIKSNYERRNNSYLLHVLYSKKKVSILIDRYK